MKHPSRLGVLVLLWLGFVSPVFAQTSLEASRLLERMMVAMNQQSFQGTFIYIKGDAVETMRITHIVDDKGVRERLYSVDGPKREIIRDEDGVRCILADGQSMIEDPVIAGSIYPEIPFDSLYSRDGHYTMTTNGRGRMAGHAARRVSIEPRDEFRYGYELWLEQKSGLLLKWVLFDARREALAKLMFTSLSIGEDIDISELESDADEADFVKVSTPMPSSNTVASTPKWKPSQLPPGFQLAAHNLVEKHGRDVYEHLVYSDGLASVSVYIEDETLQESPDHGSSALGTANAFSRHIGGKHVTVIGEVPSVTVRAIGDAVEPPAVAEE